MSTTGFSPFGSAASPTNTTWNEFNSRALRFIAHATSPRGALLVNFTRPFPFVAIPAGAPQPAEVLPEPVLAEPLIDNAANLYNLNIYRYDLAEYREQDKSFSDIADFLVSPEQITDDVRKQLVSHLGGDGAMLMATPPELYRGLRAMFGTTTAAALNSVYEGLSTSTFSYVNQGSLQLFITKQQASFQLLADNQQAVNDARQIALLENSIMRGAHRDFFSRTITDFEQDHPLLDANRTYRALADQLIITNNLLATGHLRAMGAIAQGNTPPEHRPNKAEAQIAALTKQLKAAKALHKLAGKPPSGMCTIHGPGHSDEHCFTQHPELRSSSTAPNAPRHSCTIHGPGHSDDKCYAQHPELRPAGQPGPGPRPNFEP